jgi:hypothetical protein
MFAVFPVMRQLTELLWHLTEARTLLPGGPLRAEVEAALEQTDQLTRAVADELAGLDAAAYRQVVGDLLGRVSDAVRSDVPGRTRDRRGADLMGAALRGADLRAADLTGAIFLTQPQLTAATGNAATRVPVSLSRPPHWATDTRTAHDRRSRRPRRR